MGGNKAMMGIDGCNDRHLPVFLTLCMRAYIVLGLALAFFLNKMNSRLRAVNQA